MTTWNMEKSVFFNYSDKMASITVQVKGYIYSFIVGGLSGEKYSAFRITVKGCLE